MFQAVKFMIRMSKIFFLGRSHLDQTRMIKEMRLQTLTREAQKLIGPSVQ